MANEYFQPGSVPAPNAPGSSAVMRQEFASISTGFDKLPILAGHANELVTVNATGTALVTGGTVLGDYVTKDGVFTLTNKTMAWADNIWPGFGTGATKNAGTGAGEVLLLSQSNKLPALDGSLLTGVTTSQISGVTDIAHGGTGATTLGGAQAALGINLKADANNAVLTGAPTAPTPPTGDNSARVATTFFVTETLANIGGFAPSNAAPLMNGVVSAGVGALGSRDDHVHPTDTTRAPINSPTFTGNPTAPTPAVNDNDTSIATTAFVNAEIAADRPYPNAVPLMDGAAAMGAAANVARQDHVHPTDTTRAPINSPTFTGDPRAPTPLTSDNDTSIATTAFVQSLIAQQPPGVQVSNSNPLMNGAVAPGTGVEASRYDHVHPSDTSRVAKSGDTMTGSLVIDAGSFSAVTMRVYGTAKGSFYANAGGVGLLNSLDSIVFSNPTGTTDLAVTGNLTAANLSGTNSGDQTAALVPFTPAGNIAASNVQAAIQELDVEKVPYTYLSAVNTPFTPAGNIAASNVQAAIQELDSEAQAGLATKVSKSGDTMTGNLAIDYAGPNVTMKHSGTTKGSLYADAGGIGLLNNLGNGVFYNPTGTTDLAVAGNLTAANLSGTNTGNQTAALVPFTPSGNIAASNVQAALQEVDTETQAGLATKVSKSGDTMTGMLLSTLGNGPAFQINRPSFTSGRKGGYLGLYDSNLGFSLGNLTDNGSGIISSLNFDNEIITFSRSLHDRGTGTGQIPMLQAETKASLPFANHYHGGKAQALWSYLDPGSALGTIGFAATFGNGQFSAWVLASDRQSGNLTITGQFVPGASDTRLKENKVKIADPLGKLSQLSGYEFDWAEDGPQNERGHDTGLIAQEVQEVFPQCVALAAFDRNHDSTSKSGENYLTIKTGNQITALLVESVKELSAKLDAAVAEIAALKADK